VLVGGVQEERRLMSEERWDDDRANRLLDAALEVLEAAGGWQTPGDCADDPTKMLRFAELFFSKGVRQKIWPHIDLMNRGIEAENPEELRLGVLGLLRVVLCAEEGFS
jgi:hypothetical protein